MICAGRIQDRKPLGYLIYIFLRLHGVIRIKGGQDACQGDSGGPLVETGWINGEPVEWQVGIVSFGIGCGRPGLGAVYSSIDYYSEWIANVINHYVAYVQ